MAKFTKSIVVTPEMLHDVEFTNTLQRGQWLDQFGMKGQFIGIDYANVAYVCWCQSGETMQQRNNRFKLSIAAYLHILCDQEDAIDRHERRQRQLDVMRYYLHLALQFIVAMFTVGYSRDSLETRARQNNLAFVYNHLKTQPYRFIDDTCGYNVLAANTEHDAHELLDNYAHGIVDREPITYARVLYTTVSHA